VIDLHVHTWRCRHADGLAEEYVRAASASGVTILGFTEHLPMDPVFAASVPGAAGYAMPAVELDAYVEEVRQAAAVGRELGVEVLLAAEADVVPASVAHSAALIAEYPFDYVLGSVHFIGEWAFDDPDRIDRYDAWTPMKLWERYFDELILAAGAGLVDVMAHADLVKKFRGRPDEPVEHLYSTAAEAFAQAGVAVEINTAGLRKPCRELYPDVRFLRSLHRSGVGITLGSDAHRPSEVGADMDAALASARDAGYRSALVYRGRQPEEVGLDEL
jgi:histidinol-phosphatase (PHP family)